jgi:acetyl esterase/lipase
MSLLYPSAQSYHAAVPASEICIAGDSAGGNLALALLQLILELKRQSPDGIARLMWHAHVRELPLPAGVAVLSPYIDLTRSLDSEDKNLQYDFLPPRGAPFTLFEPCGIWPVYPPRHHPYANDNALLHPMVSPVTAQDWSGAPPVWICEGEECLSDAGMFLSQQLASQGVSVIFEQYAAMPHVFPIVFPDLLSSRKCLNQWGRFIRTLVDDPTAIQTEAVRWSGTSLTRVSFDIKELVSVTLKELKVLMRSEIKLWGLPPAAHPPA